ncbi:MAG TPA: PEP-CTERM sorting domain-containing protein [Phycisphaerae bacterium]|nr:PEP-CTERM sorting domain-containing protein [Phycisphaerae bacterium]
MKKFFASLSIASAICLSAQVATADLVAQTLPFSQNWSNAGLITADDNWSGVPGINGYRGDGLSAATGTNPQTLLADDAGLVLDVNADEANPNTFTTGGVSEFAIADPVVALQGSGTADAPYLLLSIDSTGFENVSIAYTLRDIDGAADNAVQPIALQYRLGNAGAFTNVPTAFVADASTGPSLAVQVTPVLAIDAAWDNVSLVQFRIMTSDAVGSDEWIGIDDITVVGTIIPEPATLSLLAFGAFALIRRKR